MTWHILNISKAEVEQNLASLFQQSLGQTPRFQFVMASFAQLGNYILNNIYFKHCGDLWLQYKKMLHILFSCNAIQSIFNFLKIIQIDLVVKEL